MGQKNRLIEGGPRRGLFHQMRLLPFWFCLLLCGSAAAQPTSDTELQAAYCLGVTALQAEARAAELKKEAADPEMTNYDQDVLRTIQERQKRFRDYLGAKGDQSPEASRIASERGKKDETTCDAELEQCSDRCDRVYGENIDAWSDCTDKCPIPDSCKRVAKCGENFIPF